MKITFEIESFEELEMLLAWRDGLRDRIAKLEATPLRFSLADLARRVLDGEDCRQYGLTPDQRERLRDAIEKG